MEVGNIFPQTTCISIHQAHSIQFDEFANLDFELLFQLESKTKLTDIISQVAISANGLLINKKVKDLLSQFNIIQHRYYKSVVRDLIGTDHEYFWLHLVDRSILDKIDYSKSVFYWSKSTFRKDLISIASYDDYLQLKKQNGILWGVDIDKIVFNKPLNKRLDLFSFIPFDLSIYISEELQKCLRANNVTGIEINQALTIEEPD